MSLDPHGLFAKVHPDLVKVMQVTAQSPQPFQVVYGLRTLGAEQEAVATGHSTTMHSRHLANKDGLACAVDVAALVDGHISWDTALYSAIAAQVKTAASMLKIPVEWGGDWHSFRDYGHYQLPWSQYP